MFHNVVYVLVHNKILVLKLEGKELIGRTRRKLEVSMAFKAIKEINRVVRE